MENTFKNFKINYRTNNVETIKNNLTTGATFESYLNKNLTYKVINRSGDLVLFAQVNQFGEVVDSTKKQFIANTLAALIYNHSI